LALDSVETQFGSVREALGGSGAFFALGARLFCPVELVAVVGRDFPPEHLELLREHGVGLSHVEHADGETFRWGGRYRDDGEERDTLFTHLNVFEGWVPDLPQALRQSPHLFLANLDPDIQSGVLGQVEEHDWVACDTMNLWIETKRDLLVHTLGSVDICILNDGEARLLAGGDRNLITAGRRILAMGPEIVVIKKGEHGALMMTAESTFVAPSLPLEEVRDPTGAGDTFAGGFLGYLASTGQRDSQTLRRAVAYGTAAASFCVEQFSVQGLVGLTRQQIDERARELQALSAFDLVVEPARP
jgi:sugar/nucleoside kinase (ribokinase family)